MDSMVLLVSSLLLIARVAATFDPVLDLDGNELRRGQRYYAVPVLRPNSGLTLMSPEGSSCPLNVVGAPFGDYTGRPLAFFPEGTDDVVRQGPTLYVMFPEPTDCPQSTVWKIDSSSNQSIVTTGGTMSSSFGGHDSRFAIRKTRHWYQFEYCPCSLGEGLLRPTCLLPCLGSLGLVMHENMAQLAIGGNSAYGVLFRKVEDGVARSS